MAKDIAKPKRRRWLALSLRGLIVLVLVVGVGLGWLVQRAKIQREAVAAIKAKGDLVVYSWDYDFEKDETRYYLEATGWQNWLEKHIGRDYLESPVSVSHRGPGTRQLLLSIGRLRSLRSLSLLQADASEADYQHIEKLSELRKLDISFGTPLSCEVLEHIRPLGKLRELELHFSIRLEDACLGPIGALKELRKLSLMDASAEGFSDHGLQQLAGLTKLEELKLACGRITSDGLKPLSNMTRMKRLTLVTKSDLDLKRLAPMEDLEELTTPYATFDDADCETLSTFKKLRKLNTGGRGITDAGLVLLANLRGLEELNLGASQISDQGLQSLVPLPKLKVLELSLSDLNDQSVPTFARFVSSPKIQAMYTKITEAGAAELRKQRPDIVIEVNSDPPMPLPNFDPAIPPQADPAQNVKKPSVGPCGW
jgi:internalin A